VSTVTTGRSAAMASISSPTVVLSRATWIVNGRSGSRLRTTRRTNWRSSTPGGQMDASPAPSSASGASPVGEVATVYTRCAATSRGSLATIVEAVSRLGCAATSRPPSTHHRQSERSRTSSVDVRTGQCRLPLPRLPPLARQRCPLPAGAPDRRVFWMLSPMLGTTEASLIDTLHQELPPGNDT
jgi:hypothetical protein